MLIICGCIIILLLKFKEYGEPFYKKDNNQINKKLFRFKENNHLQKTN